MARILSSLLGLTLCLALLSVAYSTTVPACSSTVAASLSAAPVDMPAHSERSNSSIPNEKCGGGASDRFMYNLWQGPPNQYIASTGSNRPVSKVSSRAGVNGTAFKDLWWSANMTCKQAGQPAIGDPNGHPMGCCLNVMNNLLMGCYRCDGSATAMLPEGVSATNVKIVNGAQSSGTTFTPNTDNVLRWPQSASGNERLGPGVYSFQLWAESLCGKSASKTLTLAARCPPSPIVRAVIRNGQSSSVATWDSTEKAYIVKGEFYIDPSCSVPFQVSKAGSWPTGNYKNLYAIQNVYYTVVDASVVKLGNTANQFPKTVRQTFNGNQAGITATMRKQQVKGQIIITVEDGCSAAQQTLSVFSKCGCKPTAKVNAVSTLWSNVPTAYWPNWADSSMMNNQASRSAGGGNQIGYSLDGSGSTVFDTSASALNLDYDWSFVSWLPDYKTEMYGMQSLKDQFGTNFPPSAKAACGGGLSSAQCGASDPFGLSDKQCCFSSSDVVHSLNSGVFARPSVGSYVYKALQVTTTTTSNNVVSRKKEYNFMRLAGACQAPNVASSWSTDTTVAATTVVGAKQCNGACTGAVMSTADNAYVSFVALPKFVTTWGDTLLPDFNVPDRGSATKFMPTTECGAWMKVIEQSVSVTDTQKKTETTLQCSGENDLQLCRVTIGQNDAKKGAGTLMVSSFGSCRGAWNFKLTVSDSCQTSEDMFALSVGCNRRPNVIAGCSNSQVWDGMAFEQISLDGRASWDPDNFGDVFNGLTANDRAPACASKGTCKMGGLGDFGLTYAWALVAAPGGYSNTNGTNCPFANVHTQCKDSYCCSAGSDNNCWFAYPFMDYTTGKWASANLWPGRYQNARLLVEGETPPVATITTRANPLYDGGSFGSSATPQFGASVMGETTLFQAWGSQNVQYKQKSDIANNTLPAALNPASPDPSMFNVRIFPSFFKNCAPTVYPIFLNTGAQMTNGLFNNLKHEITTAQLQGWETWRSIQQLQHQGNTAYINGLAKEGTYVARLYAFDGCSVGYGEVTFTTECSKITMETVATYNRFGVNTTFTSGVKPTLFNFQAQAQGENQFKVRYDGLSSNTLSGTVTIVPRVCTNGQCVDAAGAAIAGSCAITQVKELGSERLLKVGSGAGDACVGNLIWGRGTGSDWLAPGEYAIRIAVNDKCVSLNPASVSIDFKVVCGHRVILQWHDSAKKVITSNASPQTATAYYQWVKRYSVSNSKGTFPAFTLPVSAMVEQPKAGTTDDTWEQDTSKTVVLKFGISWNAKYCALHTCQPGQASDVYWPIAYVDPKATDFTDLASFTKTAAAANNDVSFKASERLVTTFPNANAQLGAPINSNALWTRTGGTNFNPGGMWNTILSAAQVAMIPSDVWVGTGAARRPKSSAVFQWSGTYKIQVTGVAYNGNSAVSCSQETKVGAIAKGDFSKKGTTSDTRNNMEAYVSYACDELSDPTGYLNRTSGVLNPVVMFKTAGSNAFCSIGAGSNGWCGKTSATGTALTAISGAFEDVSIDSKGWNTPIPTVDSKAPVSGSCTGGSGWTVNVVVDGKTNSATAKCGSDGKYSIAGLTPQASQQVEAYYAVGATAGGIGGFYGGSGPSTVAMVPSYVSPTTTTNFMGTTSALNQNQLLISPVALAQVKRGFAAAAVVVNQNPNILRLSMPGTWKIEVYGTNGCQNVSGTGFELLYQCPLNTLPSALMDYSVKSNLATITTEMASDRVIRCGANNNGPGSYPKNVTGFRRRLLEDDDTESHASRKLLQLTNGHYGDTSASPAYMAGQANSFDKNAADTVCTTLNKGFAKSPTYQLGTGGNNIPAQNVLYSNYDSYVPIFFDSFAIASQTGVTKNWFGMGELFPPVGSDKGVSYNIYTGARPSFVGAFEKLTLTAQKLTTTSGSNNKAFSWFNLNDWATQYTCGSTTDCQTPTGGAANCQWIRQAVQGATGANGGKITDFNRVASSTNLVVGKTDPLFATVGCNNLGGSADGGVWLNSDTTGQKVWADGGWGALAVGTNVANTKRMMGLIKTRQQAKDVQMFAWNGAPGASCYDYRAVRVVARCNVLFPMKTPKLDQGPADKDADAGKMARYQDAGRQAQYPDIHVDGSADPLAVSNAAGATTAAWTGSNFKTVELEGKFNYYQCGMYKSDISFCGQAVQSGSNQGNLFSLVYHWQLLTSPVGSWYMMGNYGNHSQSFFKEVYSAQKQTDKTNSTSAAGLTITTTYQRTRTVVTNTVRHEVKLINHAFNLPKTCIRPDVEGPYVVRLDIDDGCATWRSAEITIQATCPDLPAIKDLTPVAIWPGEKTWTDISGSSATPVEAKVNGDVYNRINIAISPVPPANTFYTYSWSIATPTGYTETVKLTNSQGTAVSFTPVQMPMTMPSSSKTQYTLTLKITNNCQVSNGATTQGTPATLPKTMTYSFKINVVCELKNMNFVFKAPIIKTAATTAEQTSYWGGTTTYSVTGAAQDAREAEYGYYSDSAVMMTTSSSEALSCDLKGPFCSPSENGAVPTILFGGSLPNSVTNPTNPPALVIPGFQKYYFNVPASVDSTCVVKKTYWVLTGYKNAQSFTPQYMPAAPAAPAAQEVRCSPTQTWTLTVENTPCKPCSNVEATEAGVRDICLFRNYSDYTNIPFSTSLNTPTSDYKHPLFYIVGTSTVYQKWTQSVSAKVGPGGADYSGQCIYDAKQRKSGDSFIQARRDNCLTSGKGRQVTLIASPTATSCSNGNCPMSQIQFVPRFPGVYLLSFDVSDSCGPPVSTPIKITAQCKSRPKVDGVLKKTNFMQYYYCQNKDNKVYGDAGRLDPTPQPGAFEPLKVSDILNAGSVTTNKLADTSAPEPNSQCAVTAPSAVMNCSDVRRLVNTKQVSVETDQSNGGDKFKACCNCLYGQSTINVFTSTSSGSTNRAAPAPKQNLLALSEAEYNKNYVILVSIVAPLAVVLVASLAGNVLMVLKLRAAQAAAYAPVELSASRVNV